MKYQTSVDRIFDNRENFIVVGLTGRTGSGCSTAAEILASENIDLPTPLVTSQNANEARKYLIIYNYTNKNWHQFKWIKVTDIITSFILERDPIYFIEFVRIYCSKYAQNDELKELFAILEEAHCRWNYVKEVFDGEWDEKLESNSLSIDICNNAIECINSLSELSKHVHKVIDKYSVHNKYDINPIYQVLGDNIRSSGNPMTSSYDGEHIFSIALRINRLIKIYRYIAKHSPKKQKTLIVIDALRNPHEALWFRERYSAFYLMAINATEEDRISRLRKIDGYVEKQRKNLDAKEYEQKKRGDQIFVSQDIQKCYDLSDIHVNNPQLGDDDLNHLKKELGKYIALMKHPGLIMPTSEERCMQIAHTAKMNSGCLSRQVGAVITDENFSLKAIGWNTVPQGQTPCLLRNYFSVLSNEDNSAYSQYEKNNKEFKKKLKEIYKETYPKSARKGRNLSFCFKDVQNAIKEDKNQVHTRALHAEENAFLQIVKYGGQGILGGYLFTTSSPCELCSKKAYQLGISTIFYIDPYPGLSKDHILSSGDQLSRPKLQLFSGAIGKAYHRLYEPIIPYKDELELLFGLEKPESEKDKLIRMNYSLKEENQKLKEQLVNNSGKDTTK